MKIMILVSTVIFFLFYLSFEIQYVFSEENIKGKVEYAFHGMDDTRLRLNSGICRITGKTNELNSMTNEDIMITFDYKNGFYRFDRIGDVFSLKTPEFYYEVWFPNAVNADATRQSTASMKPSYKAKPFDINMLGFFSLIGPYWEDSYRNNFHSTLFQEKPVSYKELSDDLIYIVTERTPLINNVPPLKREYWLSKQQGYSIIKAVYCDIDTFEMSWKEINKTWVPTAFKLTSTQSYSAEWKIEWESVNEKIPVYYFEPNSLSEKPVPLFSNELGESVQIGKLGKGAEDNIDRSNNKHIYFRSTLVILGLIMIAFGLGKKYYEWKKKK